MMFSGRFAAEAAGVCACATGANAAAARNSPHASPPKFGCTRARIEAISRADVLEFINRLLVAAQRGRAGPARHARFEITSRSFLRAFHLYPKEMIHHNDASRPGI